MNFKDVYMIKTHCFTPIELNPLSSYKINIRAHNEVGQSSFKEYTIMGLTPPERELHLLCINPTQVCTDPKSK